MLVVTEVKWIPSDVCIYSKEDGRITPVPKTFEEAFHFPFSLSKDEELVFGYSYGVKKFRPADQMIGMTDSVRESLLPVLLELETSSGATLYQQVSLSNEYKELKTLSFFKRIFWAFLPRWMEKRL